MAQAQEAAGAAEPPLAESGDDVVCQDDLGHVLQGERPGLPQRLMLRTALVHTEGPTSEQARMDSNPWETRAGRRVETGGLVPRVSGEAGARPVGPGPGLGGAPAATCPPPAHDTPCCF